MELKSCDRNPDGRDSWRLFLMFLAVVGLSATALDRPFVLGSVWASFFAYILGQAILRPKDPIDLALEGETATFSSPKFGAARIAMHEIAAFRALGPVVVIYVRGVKTPLLVPRFWRKNGESYRFVRKDRRLSLERR